MNNGAHTTSDASGKRIATALLAALLLFCAGGAPLFASGKSDASSQTEGTMDTADTHKIADKDAFDKANVFGLGRPNTGYAQYFIGDSFLNPLEIGGGASPVSISNVTFEPGCRNNWHVHHATSGGGQMIICTAGSGWYQLEGRDAVSMEPGDVAYFPAGVKHWHGAKADSWFSHLAFELPGENTSNEWLEPVGDAEYNALSE